MIFHENRLLEDDSHETSYLIFFGKMLKNLSSAAVLKITFCSILYDIARNNLMNHIDCIKKVLPSAL